MGWDNPFEGRWCIQKEVTPTSEARDWLVENYGEPKLVIIENINQSRPKGEMDVKINENWELAPYPGREPISISWFKEANYKVEISQMSLEDVQAACAKRISCYTAMYLRWEREEAEEAARYLPSGKLKPVKKTK
jgi:hypothetical protein